jgi:O-acetylhomoserine (thiol)-lyase
MDRHVENTGKLARWLQQHPQVEEVNYPGLPENPNYKHASKYLQRGAGGVLSFTLKGEKEEAVRLVDNLNLVSHLANVGDSRTLIIQPSATTHQQLSPEEQEAAGVTPTQLRVSVGLEHIEDIIRDFTQAFDKLSLTK